jgi:hypothetical protein
VRDPYGRAVPIAALRPVLVTATVATIALVGLVELPTTATAAEPSPIAITEWEYKGSEFVEFTNVGVAPVDLAGWSFSDNTAVADSVALGALGTVLPGESFLLSEAAAVDFRVEWGLPDTIKVLGGNPQNLGRSDAINLYDPTNALADTLTYDDEGTGAVKGPRTDGASAWPNTAGTLLANTASDWTKSTVDDAELSWTSAGGFIGSPGISRFGTGVRWVVINELDSDSDTIELANAGPAAVDISGWTQTDSGHTPGALDEPSATTVPAHGYVTFASNQGLSGGGDTVRLYLADATTLVGSVAYGADQAEPGSWSRCPDGIGATFAHAATATFGSTNDCTNDPGGDPPTTDPNWADIVINEITSDNEGIGFAPLPTISDAIELHNTGVHDVSLDGWKQIDSGAASSAAVFSSGLYVDGALSNVIPAGGFGVFESTKGLSSGGDAVKVFTPDGTLVDELTYTAGQAGADETVNTDHTYKSLAACPDGSNTFLDVTAASFGASNATACQTGVPPVTGGSGPEADCDTEDAGAAPGTVPTGAVTWPGDDTPATIDAVCAWVTTESGQDLSGLAFDPFNPNVLYAVKNKSHVWRLLKTGDSWLPDTANGWATGKDLRFPGGSGLPDTEGVTVGPDGALYITTERDNTASSVPLDSILRFDPTTADTTLSATDQWVLTADLGFTASSDANLGFEGVAYLPDSFLLAAGFRTDAGALYDPADYPGKALAGLFLGAVEKTGHLIAYALNSDHTFVRIADISTGMVRVMDASFDADLGRIWAHCDNTCGAATTLLEVNGAGQFAVDRHYHRPANLPNYNLEGFAVAPASAAIGGQRQVLWADDGNRFGHSLWAGTIPAELALSAKVTLSSSTVAAGGKITVAATGLTPGTEYQVVLNSTPTLIGTGIAGGNGGIDMTVTIPASTPPGAHTITVASSSDPDMILASVELTVTGSLAATGFTSQPVLLGAAALLLAGAALLATRRTARRGR